MSAAAGTVTRSSCDAGAPRYGESESSTTWESVPPPTISLPLSSRERYAVTVPYRLVEKSGIAVSNETGLPSVAAPLQDMWNTRWVSASRTKRSRTTG